MMKTGVNMSLMTLLILAVIVAGAGLGQEARPLQPAPEKTPEDFFTFSQIAQKHGISIERLAEYLNRPVKEIRFVRPESLGYTHQEVSHIIGRNAVAPGQTNKKKGGVIVNGNTMVAWAEKLLYGFVGFSLLVSVAVLILKIRFGDKIKPGDF